MDKLELKFQNEIEKGNLARMKSFLNNAVIMDIDKISSIKKLIEIAEENNVFEELVDEIEKKPKDQWNGNYQDSVKTELMLNYSKERFLYFLEVAEYLNSKKDSKQKAVNDNQGKPERKNNTIDKRMDENTSQNSDKKKVNMILPILIIMVVLIAIVMLMSK